MLNLYWELKLLYETELKNYVNYNTIILNKIKINEKENTVRL